ncbi:hypothetical protein ACLOJK_004749 [Asimina triloba]
MSWEMAGRLADGRLLDLDLGQKHQNEYESGSRMLVCRVDARLHGPLKLLPLSACGRGCSDWADDGWGKWEKHGARSACDEWGFAVVIGILYAGSWTLIAMDAGQRHRMELLDRAEVCLIPLVLGLYSIVAAGAVAGAAG